VNGSGVLTPVAGTTNRFGPDGQPPWHGERLDLHHAIWTCFANARTDEEKQADWEQAQEPVFRPDLRGGDFSDTADYIRRYYEEHPAA
jgi:hypothetical protein